MDSLQRRVISQELKESSHLLGLRGLYQAHHDTTVQHKGRLFGLCHGEEQSVHVLTLNMLLHEFFQCKTKVVVVVVVGIIFARAIVVRIRVHF